MIKNLEMRRLSGRALNVTMRVFIRERQKEISERKRKRERHTHRERETHRETERELN